MIRPAVFILTILFSLHASAIEVLQATSVFGRAADLKSLQAGVSTCVVVAIFHPETRNVYFAHVDASIDVTKAMQDAVEKFKVANVEPTKLRAYIAGGWKGWSDTQSAKARSTLKNAGVKVVAYEPPIDIGYTIEDDRNLKLPPASARGKAVRSYRFDLATGRLTQLNEVDQQPDNPTSIQGLAFEPLPVEDAEKPAPPSTKLAPAAVKKASPARR